MDLTYYCELQSVYCASESEMRSRLHNGPDTCYEWRDSNWIEEVNGVTETYLNSGHVYVDR